MENEKLKWSTQKRRVDDLIPFEGNPRQMTEKQQADLKKSLEKFNLVEIPAIDMDNKICAGHQRLKIMKLLGRGQEEIDVRVPNRKLTDAEFKEYNLRSNKNVGGWDDELLVNFDEAELLRVGFESEDLDKIFREETVEDKFDVDKEYERIGKPKTKVGDLYSLGDHRLLCGDATKKDNFKELMNGKLAKLCFTSPPYNMASGMYERYKDNLKSEEYIEFNLTVIKNIQEFLKGFVFWNISYNKNTRWEFIEIIYRIIKETKLKFLELIVWDKGHALPITSKEGLTRRYEDIFLIGDEESISSDLDLYFCGRNDNRAYFNKKNQKGITNYWRIGTNKTQVASNLACFPVELPRKGIELMSDRNDIVIDPFGGSGTTLIACEQLNRKCFMIELDPKYCDIIINRWERLSGGKAIKLSGK